MATRSLARGDWTVARWRELPDDGNKYEIIDGVLYVTPSARFLHHKAIYELAKLLEPHLAVRGLAIMPRDGDLQYSERTVVQPDAFVYPSSPARRVTSWEDVHPLQVAIEVLSPSTARRDRTVKRALYQAQRIPEYWIVDLDERTVERWRPDDRESERLTETLPWQPTAAHPAVSIDLVRYFAAVLD